MVISLVYTPPFLAVERAMETAMAELSVTVSCGLIAMKLVVAQFCRAKGHEIISEGAECVRSENTMQFCTTTSSLRACHRVANHLVGVSLTNR